MRKIILASKSKARRDLLKQIGLRFQVVESKAKERRIIKGSCAKLVTENALRKARKVAKRFDTGIVIGADTLVLAGKKIIGKPKDKKDAFNTLKLLSQKPQWVYSGLAVIDIDKGKEFTAHEKTKVYMYRLKDEQIAQYIDWVNPFDKAGSFDIQGLGGIFIDRIEGCFYNVVGLPLAKLSKILKKLDVDVFKK